MKLIVPIGPAGSGKTTFWEEMSSKKRIFRISADDWRYILYNYSKGFKEEFEYKVWGHVWETFISSLRSGKNVYLDCTNLTKSRRMPFIYVAKEFGYKIEIVLFNLSIKKILKQNNSRKRKVSEDIVCKQLLSLEYPDKQEYDKLKYITNKIQVWKEK